MQKELTEYLRKIIQASYSKVEERLEKYELVKGQAQLLILIRDNDGVTQKELAKMLDVKYSSMSERLRKLENLGYVERTIDESNSKYKRIFITSSGKIAAVQCRRIQSEFQQTIYKGFAKKDINQFEKYLEKICNNIEREKNS